MSMNLLSDDTGERPVLNFFLLVGALHPRAHLMKRRPQEIIWQDIGVYEVLVSKPRLGEWQTFTLTAVLALSPKGDKFWKF